MNECVFVSIYVIMYVCMYVWLYAHTHTHTCMYVCIFMTLCAQSTIVSSLTNQMFIRRTKHIKSGTPLKMISIIIDCQLINVCLYDCVCCNYGLLKFSFLASLLIFRYNPSISLCLCLCNALLILLPPI